MSRSVSKKLYKRILGASLILASFLFVSIFHFTLQDTSATSRIPFGVTLAANDASSTIPPCTANEVGMLRSISCPVISLGYAEDQGLSHHLSYFVSVYANLLFFDTIHQYQTRYLHGQYKFMANHQLGEWFLVLAKRDPHLS